MKQKLIRALSQDEYMLVRDLGSITLWELLSTTPWAQPSAENVQQSIPAVLVPHLPDPAQLAEKFSKLDQAAHQEFAIAFRDWFSNDRLWSDNRATTTACQV